jgi:hypothetical protein
VIRTALAGRGLVLAVAVGVLATLGAVALLVALRGASGAATYGGFSDVSGRTSVSHRVVLPRPALRLERVAQSRAGRLARTRAFVGLSLAGGRLQAYVCDGTPNRRATISQWFRGRWNGRSPLTLVRHGIELHLDPVRADGTVTGRLIASGGPHAFRVRASAPPAGLYDGADRRRAVRATWIVLADGSLRGTFASPRPKRCVPVPVTGSNGSVEYVVVCR